MTTSAHHRIQEATFAFWAGPLNGFLVFALAHVFAWHAVAGLLCRRRIFVTM